MSAMSAGPKPQDSRATFASAMTGGFRRKVRSRRASPAAWKVGLVPGLRGPSTFCANWRMPCCKIGVCKAGRLSVRAWGTLLSLTAKRSSKASMGSSSSGISSCNWLEVAGRALLGEEGDGGAPTPHSSAPARQEEPVVKGLSQLLMKPELGCGLRCGFFSLSSRFPKTSAGAEFSMITASCDGSTNMRPGSGERLSAYFLCPGISSGVMGLFSK
mmetsp:Transcript_76050/g.163255  ORF Transcript_76050/g.163255 Transcript_76050/m.163255 type:complete len:215 (-) Transcript_76050:2015-2659(-)